MKILAHEVNGAPIYEGPAGLPRATSSLSSLACMEYVEQPETPRDLSLEEKWGAVRRNLLDAKRHREAVALQLTDEIGGQ